MEEERAEEDTYGRVKLLKHLKLEQTHEKRMNLQTAKHRKADKGPERHHGQVRMPDTLAVSYRRTNT